MALGVIEESRLHTPTTSLYPLGLPTLGGGRASALIPKDNILSLESKKGYLLGMQFWTIKTIVVDNKYVRV